MLSEDELLVVETRRRGPSEELFPDAAGFVVSMDWPKRKKEVEVVLAGGVLFSPCCEFSATDRKLLVFCGW